MVVSGTLAFGSKRALLGFMQPRVMTSGALAAPSADAVDASVGGTRRLRELLSVVAAPRVPRLPAVAAACTEAASVLAFGPLKLAAVCVVS